MLLVILLLLFRDYSNWKMQGNRGGRDPFFGFSDPFAGFGGFGGFTGQRSLVLSVFGGRDPFDDPFFTQPFGGMFESSIFGDNSVDLVNVLKHEIGDGQLSFRGKRVLEVIQSKAK